MLRKVTWRVIGWNTQWCSEILNTVASLQRLPGRTGRPLSGQTQSRQDGRNLIRSCSPRGGRASFSFCLTTTRKKVLTWSSVCIPPPLPPPSHPLQDLPSPKDPPVLWLRPISLHHGKEAPGVCFPSTQGICFCLISKLLAFLAHLAPLNIPHRVLICYSCCLSPVSLH